MQFFLPQNREVETKEPSIQGIRVWIFRRGLSRFTSKDCLRLFISIMYYYITEMSRTKFISLLYLLSTNPDLLVPSKSSPFTCCHPLLKGYFGGYILLDIEFS